MSSGRTASTRPSFSLILILLDGYGRRIHLLQWRIIRDLSLDHSAVLPRHLLIIFIIDMSQATPLVNASVFFVVVNTAVFLLRIRGILLVHDETVNDPVLQSIHGEREQEHGKHNLQSFVTFCPAQSPIAYPRQKGHGEEEEEDAEFHQTEADAVDEELLEVPGNAWGAIIVS